MRRTLFISIGGIILVALFVIWAYLLLFGAPTATDDLFTNLGTGGQPTERPLVDTDLGITSQLNLSSGSLFQLTLRPVAGFEFIESGNGTTTIRYAEKGTGHVYEIDLESGIETRISNQTFVAVFEAVFSPDGGKVALISSRENGREVTILSLDGEEWSGAVPEAAENIFFPSENEVRYTVKASEGTAGYSYSFSKLESAQLFAVPLGDIKVLWGEDETVVFSRPAPNLTGALYRIGAGVLSRIGSRGYSFTALEAPLISGEYLATAAAPGSEAVTSSIIGTNGGETLLPLTLLPEKCAFSQVASNTMWCGATASKLSRTALTEWYKGFVTFSDQLWRVDLGTRRAEVIEESFSSVQRYVDTIDLKADAYDAYLGFRNKNDDTLWLKRLTSTTPAASGAALDEDLLGDSEDVADGEI